MVATRGRTFKRPWRRSCLSSKLKSSSAPIGRKDSWCFHAVGSSNAPLLGSTAAEGLPRIGRTSIATRWRSCSLPQSASCSENFVIPPDVFGQTLRPWSLRVWTEVVVQTWVRRHSLFGFYSRRSPTNALRQDRPLGRRKVRCASSSNCQHLSATSKAESGKSTARYLTWKSEALHERSIAVACL